MPGVVIRSFSATTELTIGSEARAPTGRLRSGAPIGAENRGCVQLALAYGDLMDSMRLDDHSDNAMNALVAQPMADV